MGKIVLITSRFPVVSETFIVNKFQGLLNKNLDVHMVCGFFDKKVWETNFGENKNDYKRIHVRGRGSKGRAVILFPFLLLRALLFSFLPTLRYFQKGFSLLGWRIFKQFYLDVELIFLNPEIIHFEFGALAVHQTHLKNLLNAKWVVSFRGYDLNFSGLNIPNYYEKVWEKSDVVHCLGKDLWEQAKRRGCPAVKPHILIPPSVDLNFFKSTEKSLQEKIGTSRRPAKLLSIGRLEWKKGYEYAFMALRQLKKEGFSFQYNIAGSGKYLEALAFCRYEMRLEKEIHFLGAQPPSKILEEMKQTDIFIHAAVSEGFCNAVLEAQAMQVAVVCADAGGLPENIEDGITGFLAPRRDGDALAGKIKNLLQDDKKRFEMGVNGRKRVAAKFTLDSQIEMFVQTYLELAGKGPVFHGN